MMAKVFFGIAVACCGFVGFGIGSDLLRKDPGPAVIASLDKHTPVAEFKPFTVVLYAHNDSAWCERALTSLFAQDYDHYRLIVIDDGSHDNTLEAIKTFILERHREQRATLIKNEQYLGYTASLARALEPCLPKEIVVPLRARNWLSQPNVLSRLNEAFQAPDIWALRAQACKYPSYEVNPHGMLCFYSALFKAVPAHSMNVYETALFDLSGTHIRQLDEPISFANETLPVVNLSPASGQPIVRCEPLAELIFQ